jgi:hypothetical protein
LIASIIVMVFPVPGLSYQNMSDRTRPHNE